MDADGARAQQIGNLPETMLPVVPQEGKNGLIVFMGNDAATEPDGNTGIWMMRTDGSGLKELVRGMQPSLALSAGGLPTPSRPTFRITARFGVSTQTERGSSN